jgi:hypothetical protein
MNCTLMPVCSNRLPSFGRTVTAPLTDSPSIYSGAFSRRFLSSLTSTIDRSSASSSTMSISTGVAKKYDDMAAGCGWSLGWACELWRCRRDHMRQWKPRCRQYDRSNSIGRGSNWRAIAPSAGVSMSKSACLCIKAHGTSIVDSLRLAQSMIMMWANRGRPHASYSVITGTYCGMYVHVQYIVT